METTTETTTNQSKSNVSQLPDRELRILEAVCATATGEIGKRFSHKRGACIASTAIGLLVLKHFGIEAEPLCVMAMVGNGRFIKWHDAGCPPFATEAECKASGVHYVIIDAHNRMNRIDGYPGHLIIGMRQWNRVLDLSLCQFRRPQKNINVPDAALFCVSDTFWSGNTMEYRKDGVMVEIELLENPPDWTGSRDWWERTHDHHEIAKKIIRRVERETK